MITSLIGWIVLGLIAGYIASRLVNHRGEGIIMDVALGIVGAVAGGWIFRMFGSTGVTGFDVWSLFIAIIGAVVFLLVWHLVRGSAART